MLVKEVMSTNVLTIKDSTSFKEIVHLLEDHHISGAPVVNEKGKVIGIISEKDLLDHVFPSEADCCEDPSYYFDHERIEKEAKEITKLKAKNLMSKKIVSVKPNDHILKACSLMMINDIRRLPVMDNGELIGIVTTKDIYRNFLLQFAD
ncbi:CBS domain-containing protein [candidate division WWE3 bacterium]|nr:CBS domain-containing protein [candidate division WWE3 bacterium]